MAVGTVHFTLLFTTVALYKHIHTLLKNSCFTPLPFSYVFANIGLPALSCRLFSLGILCRNWIALSALKQVKYISLWLPVLGILFTDHFVARCKMLKLYEHTL
jgi:hypothetical protein